MYIFDVVKLRMYVTNVVFGNWNRTCILEISLSFLSKLC